MGSSHASLTYAFVFLYALRVLIIGWLVISLERRHQIESYHEPAFFSASKTVFDFFYFIWPCNELNLASNLRFVCIFLKWQRYAVRSSAEELFMMFDLGPSGALSKVAYSGDGTENGLYLLNIILCLSFVLNWVILLERFSYDPE